MEKVVKIGNRGLRLKSSLNTIIAYKERFGTEIFSDITKIEKAGSENISEVIEVLFRIIFILTEPNNNDSFKSFMESFELSIIADENVLQNLTNVIVELLKVDGSKGGKKEETFR